MTTPGTPDVRFFRDSIEGRRGEILDAAVSVFHARGYDAGTMREIAERVGITEPGLYRHFSGKEDLFEQLIAEAGSRILADSGPLIESIRPDTVQESFESLFAERRAAARSYLPVIQTAMLAAMHNPRFLGVYRAEFIEPLAERLTAKVAELDEHFGVDPGHRELTGRVRMLMSTFVGFFVTSLLFEDERTPDLAVVRLMGWGE